MNLPFLRVRLPFVNEWTSALDTCTTSKMLVRMISAAPFSQPMMNHFDYRWGVVRSAKGMSIDENGTYMTKNVADKHDEDMILIKHDEENNSHKCDNKYHDDHCN